MDCSKGFYKDLSEMHNSPEEERMHVIGQDWECVWKDERSEQDLEGQMELEKRMKTDEKGLFQVDKSRN